MSKWYSDGTLTFSCGSIVNHQQLQAIFDVCLLDITLLFLKSIESNEFEN